MNSRRLQEWCMIDPSSRAETARRRYRRSSRQPIQARKCGVRFRIPAKMSGRARCTGIASEPGDLVRQVRRLRWTGEGLLGRQEAILRLGLCRELKKDAQSKGSR